MRVSVCVDVTALMFTLPLLEQQAQVVEVNYILKVIEQVGDSLALRVGQHIVVVDLRTTYGEHVLSVLLILKLYTVCAAEEKHVLPQQLPNSLLQMLLMLSLFAWAPQQPSNLVNRARCFCCMCGVLQW